MCDLGKYEKKTRSHHWLIQLFLWAELIECATAMNMCVVSYLCACAQFVYCAFRSVWTVECFQLWAESEKLIFKKADLIPFVIFIVVRLKCVAYFVTDDLNVSFKR